MPPQNNCLDFLACPVGTTNCLDFMCCNVGTNNCLDFMCCNVGTQNCFLFECCNVGTTNCLDFNNCNVGTRNCLTFSCEETVGIDNCIQVKFPNPLFKNHCYDIKDCYKGSDNCITINNIDLSKNHCYIIKSCFPTLRNHCLRVTPCFLMDKENVWDIQEKIAAVKNHCITVQDWNVTHTDFEILTNLNNILNGVYQASIYTIAQITPLGIDLPFLDLLPDDYIVIEYQITGSDGLLYTKFVKKADINKSFKILLQECGLIKVKQIIHNPCKDYELVKTIEVADCCPSLDFSADTICNSCQEELTDCEAESICQDTTAGTLVLNQRVKFIPNISFANCNQEDCMPSDLTYPQNCEGDCLAWVGTCKSRSLMWQIYLNGEIIASCDWSNSLLDILEYTPLYGGVYEVIMTYRDLCGMETQVIKTYNSVLPLTIKKVACDQYQVTNCTNISFTYEYKIEQFNSAGLTVNNIWTAQASTDKIIVSSDGVYKISIRNYSLDPTYTQEFVIFESCSLFDCIRNLVKNIYFATPCNTNTGSVSITNNLNIFNPNSSIPIMGNQPGLSGCVDRSQIQNQDTLNKITALFYSYLAVVLCAETENMWHTSIQKLETITEAANLLQQANTICGSCNSITGTNGCNC